jgi:hypothetical protein
VVDWYATVSGDGDKSAGVGVSFWDRLFNRIISRTRSSLVEGAPLLLATSLCVPLFRFPTLALTGLPS